jgi:predicted PurR-regulated permease PerM
MSLPELKKRQPHRAENPRATAWLGTGETQSAVLAIVAAAVGLYFIKPILLPFVVSGIVAYVCTPLVDWLALRTRMPRALFAALLFLTLLGIAGAIAAVTGQRLINETGATLSELQGTLEQLLRSANDGQPIHLFGLSLDDQTVRTAFDRARDWFSQPDHVALLAGYGFMAVIGTFLTTVLFIWLLITGPSVARGLFWLVPPSRRELVAQIWLRLDPVLKRYFLGIAVTVGYATIAAYIGLALILGLHHALLLALLTGVAETLPFIGSTAAAVIAGLVALHTATGIASIVAFAAYATVLRLSIDQLVAPLVLGRAANVHPVLIIFCFLAGAVTFGIAGVILSVPVALTIKTTLATLYGDDNQQVTGCP